MVITLFYLTFYLFFVMPSAKKVTIIYKDTIEAHNNTLKSTKKVSFEKKFKLRNNLKPGQVKNYAVYYHENRSPIVIEKYKLMWFLNPKAASITTRTLLARMMNQQVIHGVTKYKDLLNFKKLREYPVKNATEFLNSPEWTRVIILRDPKERILSAYLDKEQRFHVENKTSDFRRICCDEDSTMSMKDCKNHKFNFSEFLNLTRTCTMGYHCKSQYEEIDDWSVINFPINFKNLANDTEVLLRKLGNNVWQDFGATGYGINGTSAIFKENTYHATGAKTKMDNYYTPTIENIVEKRFSKDYDLLRDYFPDDY